MKPGQFVRHGDVLVMRVDDDAVPTEATLAEKDMPAQGQAVLAYGEVTGHRHLLTAQEETVVKLFEVPALAGAMTIPDRFLTVEAPEDTDEAALLTHEEHGPIHLPNGTYRVRIQQEYSPEAVRNVMD